MAFDSLFFRVKDAVKIKYEENGLVATVLRKFYLQNIVYYP